MNCHDTESFALGSTFGSNSWREERRSQSPSVEEGCLLEINIKGAKRTFSGSTLLVVIVKASVKKHKKEFPQNSTYFQIQQTILATIKRRQVWTFSNAFRNVEIVPSPKPCCTFEGKICVCLKKKEY